MDFSIFRCSGTVEISCFQKKKPRERCHLAFKLVYSRALRCTDHPEIYDHALPSLSLSLSLSHPEILLPKIRNFTLNIMSAGCRQRMNHVFLCDRMLLERFRYHF